MYIYLDCCCLVAKLYPTLLWPHDLYPWGFSTLLLKSVNKDQPIILFNAIVTSKINDHRSP